MPGRGSDGLELVGAGAGERLPALDLGGAVPADVERHPVVRSRIDRHGWLVDRISFPREAECPVGLGAARELGVEEEFAFLAVLGEKRRAAPTYEGVTVRQGLHVALGG